MIKSVPPYLADVLAKVETPSYVVDLGYLANNLKTADRVRKETGCKMLLATKAFAMPSVFPMMRESLDGTTASSVYEARLGRETFGKEVHAYAPAFAEKEIHDLLPYADHVYLNSVDQARCFIPILKPAGKKIGVRINPGYSMTTVGGDLYNPCAPHSRFGIAPRGLGLVPWEDIDVLHVHALCEASSDGSAQLIHHVAETFGEYVRQVKAVNFGGGHFMNKEGYNVDVLIKAIKDFRASFNNVDVILEPGGGLTVDAGYLICTVLDIIYNEKAIAIVDASACCHMPDVLEAPYTPPLFGAGGDGYFEHSYIIGGKTCMAGDVMGRYSFKRPLKVGDKLVFGDMAQYSFVKNNTFNGTPLPDLATLDSKGNYKIIRRFSYDDFKSKLG